MDLMLKPRYPYSFTVLESPSSPPSALQGCTYLYFNPGTWGTWGSLKIQETSPAAQTHAQPYLHITGGERGQDSSKLLPPPVCRLPSNPVSTMVLLLGLPHEKRPPQPNSSPFWKALLTLFCHGMAYPDWCYGEEGSGRSFPRG